MAKCPFYKYYHGNFCMVTNKNTDSNIYNRYCDTYSYDKCPIYQNNKNSGSSGGCFLTSACVEAMGLADDCHELTTLRKFRDEYLRQTENGSAEIEEYYTVAPLIVKKIKENDKAMDIFSNIYHELVKPCVDLICNGNNEAAHVKYRDYVQMLKEVYVVEF